MRGCLESRGRGGSGVGWGRRYDRSIGWWGLFWGGRGKERMLVYDLDHYVNNAVLWFGGR